MDNGTIEKKRHRWEWIPILLAMLLSFFCVFTATAMALMSQPDKLDDASMLPVGTANYGFMDSDKERFAQLDEAIFADATQDSAGLRITPGSSNEAFGKRETPIYIAFVTPVPSETPVNAPVIVTMDAPGTAVPSRVASQVPTATTQPTRTPRVTPTNTSTRLAATATGTPGATPTSSRTPFPTPSSTHTSVPPSPTATSKSSTPPTSTPRPSSTHTPVPTTAVTPTFTPTHTKTPIPPTATNTPPATATHTKTPIPPTATKPATATATNLPPSTATNTPIPTATTVPTNTATAIPTATNTPPATATTAPSIRVVNIELINAETDGVIYNTMLDGIELDLTWLPTDQLNMRTTLDPVQADHVDISLNGIYHHTEYVHPYTFPGNSGGDYHGYVFAPGAYTLTFEPYALDGTPGTPFVFNFTVIRSVVQQVSPVLECVTDNGSGNYTAIFGYNNPNAYEINIPVGIDNKFSPDPINRGQPEYFHPGRTYRAISLGFTSGNNIVWSLDGNTATGDSGGSPCTSP